MAALNTQQISRHYLLSLLSWKKLVKIMRFFANCWRLLLIAKYAVCFQLLPNVRRRSKTDLEMSATPDFVLTDRKTLLRHVLRFGVAAATSQLVSPEPVYSAPTPKAEEVISSISDATDTLQKLIDNWNKAVIDCTYADVPRELLEAKNKELLLEKASTYALFDKSVSVVSCKTSNRLVRDYLGRTGKGPVVGLDKRIREALEFVDDPDDLDAFVQASEALSQALSKADSLSYTAGVADFSAVNNFDKDDEAAILSSNSNLEQARAAIEEAVATLNTILAILRK